MCPGGGGSRGTLRKIEKRGIKKAILFVRIFLETLELASENDFIYCDPPYIDRHTDYFNTWIEMDELNLFNFLTNTKSRVCWH